jgi:hypothetical protein
MGLAGAVGFATVAIGSGPFLKSVLIQKNVAHLIAGIISVTLCIRRQFSRRTQIGIAASGRTEMQQFAIFAQRNGEHLGKVHTAHRIAHQEARGLRRMHIARGLRWFLRWSASQPIG